MSLLSALEVLHETELYKFIFVTDIDTDTDLSLLRPIKNVIHHNNTFVHKCMYGMTDREDENSEIASEQ